MHKEAKPIASFIIYLVLQVYFSLIGLKILENATSLSHLIFEIIKYLIIIIILIFLNKIDLKKEIKDFKLNYKKYLKLILSIWLIGFILMIISNYFITKTNTLPNNELSVRTYINSKFIESLITTVIMAPILEEITYRYSISKIKNKYLYLIISTLLFAMMHINLENISELPFLIPYSCLGLSFSFIFYKTKNILASITAHALHNYVIIMLLLIL
jgi:uncharacterized protein